MKKVKFVLASWANTMRALWHREDSVEFLPAALEVVSTPPSPVGRVVLWAIVIFFLLALLWACFGWVDIVAVAQGKIVPSGRVKVIQPLDTGVVKAIYIEDGQRVQHGDTLLELDSTSTTADRVRLQEDIISLEMDRVRLTTLLRFLDDIAGGRSRDAADDGCAESVSTSEPCIAAAALLQYLDAGQKAAQLSLFSQRVVSQRQQFISRQAALMEEVHKQQAEQKSVQQKIEQLDATIPLITERVNAMRKMVETGVVSRMSWLEVEEQRINQEKERDIQRSNLERLHASVAAAGQQAAVLSLQQRADWLGELSEVDKSLHAMRQELVKAEQKQTLQKLLAPVDGVVQQLAVHTVGGVVTPAQQLMLIVPDTDAIEVEAWVQNRDIGFVETGQAAEIKVETFPFTKYGVIDGRIMTLSNDAVPNEEQGLIYIARVAMQKTTMQVNGKIVNLSPGMAVTVEVKTGKRRIIEFVLSPLLRYKEESVKER